MNKNEAAKVLSEIGELLELKGENPFKARSYQNASRVLEAQTEDLSELIQSGKIQHLKGIGEGLRTKILELHQTGRLPYYEELKASIPAGLFEMLRIPSLGPQRVKVIHDRLGIQTLQQLQEACQQNKLLSLGGFGEKIQENILKGLDLLRQFSGQFLYPQAWSAAQDIVKHLCRSPALKKIEIAGSLRRRKEVVRDIDLVATARDRTQLTEDFVSYPAVAEVLARGETKSAVRLENGLQVDLRIVEEEEFPHALAHFTGSKEHNIALRSRAQNMGLKINEYGLFKEKTERRIPCRSEADFFKALDLAYIEPELRENLGEVEAAEKGTLPTLIDEKDIQGIFHVHSTYSDGTASLEEMIQTAIQYRFKYLGISDHSQSAAYAGGMKKEDVERQWKELEELQKKYAGEIRIFRGCEIDILGDGSLDYPESLLRQFDFLIASVHSRFTTSEEEMTRRIVKAIENPYTTMIGHLTGRLLLEREGYAVNVPEVLKAAARHGVGIELNAHPKRLDLDWRYHKLAKELGIKISINPDAHAPQGLLDTYYGVGMARKGWLEGEDVITTWDADRVADFLQRHHQK